MAKLASKNSNALGSRWNDLRAIISGKLEWASTKDIENSAAAVNAAIGGDGFTQKYEFKLQDSDGNLIESFDGDVTVAAAAVTDGDGDVNIDGGASDTVTFVGGYGSVVVTYTGTWAADDTCTVTVGDSTSVAGNTVSDKDIVDTLVA